MRSRAILSLFLAAAFGVAARAAAPKAAGTASDSKAPARPPSCAQPRGPNSVPRGFQKDAVTVECDDAYRMAADYTKRVRPRGPMPGVIFLHEDGRDRHSWHAQTVFTAARGLAALALDLRGYGENPGSVGNPEKTASAFTDADYRLMLGDVRNAVSFLAVKNEVDGGRLALVGSGMGANLALLAAGEPWAEAVQVVIAVSPALEWKGLRVGDAVAKIPKSTRIYLAAAKDDPEGWQACEAFMPLIRGPKEFVKFDTGGRGTALFHGRLFQQIPTWLASNLVQPLPAEELRRSPPVRRIPAGPAR